MARGQVLGGALQVREVHKSINPEGCLQRFRGNRESIPTAMNFLKMDQSLPVRPYYVPHSRDFEGLGGQGYLLTQRAQRPGRGIRDSGVKGGANPTLCSHGKGNPT
jgi:hypothetical protein